MPFKVVIPARFGSSRLPGKPLLDIGGRPLLAHVVDRARESGADEIVVATDDQRIVAAAESLGALVMLTSAAHESGTERIAEVIARSGWHEEVPVVNLQGDEPFMPAGLVKQVANDLIEHPQAPMATLCAPIDDPLEIVNPNTVKVVIDSAGYAVYFSRAAIPWDRECFPLQPGDEAPEGYLRHIGLYAYRAGFVSRYTDWPVSPLETVERLEQLRVLWHGERIHVSITHEDTGVGVDTALDLERARRRFLDG